MSNNIFKQQDSFPLDNQNYTSLTNFFNFNHDSLIDPINRQQLSQQQNYYFFTNAHQDSFQSINHHQSVYMQQQNSNLHQNQFHQHLNLNNQDSSFQTQDQLFANLQQKHKDFTLLQQIQQEKSSDHSSFQNSSHQTIQSYLDIIQKKMCLRTASIQDINLFLKNNINIPKNSMNKTYKDIINQVMKKKMILKRQKAKNRNTYNTDFQIMIKKQYIQQSENEKLPAKKIGYPKDRRIGNCYIDQQKRKRNRISAQVSRDRRKNYLNQLQKNNLIMKQQHQNIIKQNQRLKLQIQALRKVKDVKLQFQDQSHKKFDKFNLNKNSKLMKLLIFLGIIFLISTVKNVISPQKESTFLKSKRFNSLNGQNSSPQFGDKLGQSFNDQLIQYSQQEKSKIVQQASDILNLQFQRLSFDEKSEQQQVKGKRKGRKKKVSIQQENQLVKIEDALLKEKNQSIIPRIFNPIEVTSLIINYIYGTLPNLKNKIMLPRKLVYQIRQIKNSFE